MTTRRRFTSDFKSRVTLEALLGDKTIQEIASKHKVRCIHISEHMEASGHGRAWRGVLERCRPGWPRP